MKLSIIIPTKNEEKYIGTLLNDLIEQSYKDFDIIISDANSTDGTINIIKKFKDQLNIKIVDGGLPSVGRNNGSEISKSDILLFIDADIRLLDECIIEKSLDVFRRKNIHLLTSNIKCINSKKSNIFYKINNIIQHLSKFYKPFSTGMYFMIRKDIFDHLGGFNIESKYAEDYELSSKVNKKNFFIIDSFVYTDDRRFKKMGYIKIIKMFFNVMINSFLNKKEIYKKDNGYWL